MTSPGLPVTWPDLIAQDRPEVEGWLAELRERRVEADEIVDGGGSAARTLLGIPSLLAEVAVMSDPATCLEIIESWEPIVQSALQELGDDIAERDRVVATVLLSFINVARCCDAPLHGTTVNAARNAEQRWIPSLAAFKKDLSDRERWLVSLAAIATGQSHLVPDIAGGGPLSESISPGRTFDFNVQEFVRYLAAAQLAGASLQDVMPATENFIDRFPYKLNAGSLRFDELLFAGRAVFSQIGGSSEGTVGVEMHRIVTNLV